MTQELNKEQIKSKTDELRQIYAKGGNSCIDYLRRNNIRGGDIERRKEDITYIKHNATTFELVKAAIKDDELYGVFQKLFDIALQAHGQIVNDYEILNYFLHREAGDMLIKEQLEELTAARVLIENRDDREITQSYTVATLERLYKQSAGDMAQSVVAGLIGKYEKQLKRI